MLQQKRIGIVATAVFAVLTVALLLAVPAWAQGGPCSQCQGGPHFVDFCGPFPPVGTDLIADNGAIVGIDLDFDCVRDINLVLEPCPRPDDLLHVNKTLGPVDDSVNYPGVSPVDGHPTGPGLDVIDVEIVSMCLTDSNFTLVAGAGGPSIMPLLPSFGTVAEDLATPEPAIAGSFFDVFFEVQGIAGGPVYNQSPLRLESPIECLPPAANYVHPAPICLPLTTRGACSDDGSSCVTDLDCPQGTCEGEVLLANLVTANHSVNQPLCSDPLFPQCLGDCPAGEICVPDPPTDRCICEPPPPPPCEQTPFPECFGECPPGEICEPDLLGDTCRCVPAPPPPCDQSPFPECLGECPPGDICVPNPIDEICECQLPPPCDQAPFPECLGECPPGTACTPDPTGGACICSTVGEPCVQCGPGPHFIDACGPFPPVGSDLVSDNSAIVGIDLDFDCVQDVSLVLGPCPLPQELLHIAKTLGPLDDSANYPGVSPVDGHPTGPGLDVIDTEIVEMCLTNGAFTLIAGAGAPSTLPLLSSVGTVVEDWTTPDATIGDSFFEVFFEVRGIPGGPVYNQSPILVESRIDCLPPKASYNHPPGLCLPLTTEGTCIGGIHDGNPCIGDVDCPPDGVCVGQLVLANLVGANHSVNQPVCSDALFPECLGDCPAGQVCATNPFTGQCFCMPPAPPCEQGEFPECLGECPPDEICVPDESLGVCRCEPLQPPLCADAIFPECDGACPPGYWCETANNTCECLPCFGNIPGEITGVRWPEKARMIWDPESCANVYNVYRYTAPKLADTDNDGLADDYGSCYQPGLPVTEMVSPANPASGFVDYYLVTGKNMAGEGTLGHTSSFLIRPNLSPCP